MKYIFTAIFSICYAFFGLELGYTNKSGILSHFTYMFQHVNIIHLLLNSFSFIVVWIALQKHVKQLHILPVFLIAFMVSFLHCASFTAPTVGVSGVIYAMMGILTLYIKNKNLVIFLLSVLASLGVSYFVPNSNFFVHLYCFVGGAVYGMLDKITNNIYYD